MGAGNRCSEPACGSRTSWREIGKRCSTGRRSLWMRLEYVSPVDAKRVPQLSIGTIKRLELCSGREGDDGYLSIRAGDPLFRELLDVMLDADFAART